MVGGTWAHGAGALLLIPCVIRQSAGRGQAPPPRSLPSTQASVCCRDSGWPPPARPVLPDFGPERVQGRPRSHSPREQRSSLPGSPSVLTRKAGGAGGPPRSPGSSRGHGEHRPGRGRIRAGPPQGGAARATADPGPAAAAAAPAVSAPPPWNSDPARRGRVGPRALKGAAQFSAWLGGLGEELESPDGGRARNPVCDEKPWHSWPGAEARPGRPGDPIGPDVPSPYGLVPPVPSTLLGLLERDLGASNCTPSPIVASLEKGSLFPRGTLEAIEAGGWGGAAKSPPAGVDFSKPDK